VEEKVDYMKKKIEKLEERNVVLVLKCKKFDKELEKKKQDCAFLITENQKLEKKITKSTLKKKLVVFIFISLCFYIFLLFF
jgi:phage shock protein A